MDSYLRRIFLMALDGDLRLAEVGGYRLEKSGHALLIGDDRWQQYRQRWGPECFLWPPYPPSPRGPVGEDRGPYPRLTR